VAGCGLIGEAGAHRPQDRAGRLIQRRHLPGQEPARIGGRVPRRAEQRIYPGDQRRALPSGPRLAGRHDHR
jgi:hypothetical protein